MKYIINGERRSKMINRSDLQLVESEIISMGDEYLETLARETRLDVTILRDIHLGNEFVTSLSYSGIQRIQAYFVDNPPFDTVTGEVIDDIEQLRLYHRYDSLEDDLQTVISQHNFYNGDEINAFSPIWIERDPRMKPGEGYRAITRFFLPALGGVPHGEVTLQPSLVGDVLEEMRVMNN